MCALKFGVFERIWWGFLERILVEFWSEFWWGFLERIWGEFLPNFRFWSEFGGDFWSEFGRDFCLKMWGLGTVGGIFGANLAGIFSS